VTLVDISSLKATQGKLRAVHARLRTPRKDS
jgi:hypothetical protein